MHAIIETTVGFDARGREGATVLSIGFRMPLDAADGTAELLATLHRNGRELVATTGAEHGDIRVDRRGADRDGLVHYRARVLGVRALTPGVYGLRIRRNGEVVARIPFEIAHSGTLRAAGDAIIARS